MSLRASRYNLTPVKKVVGRSTYFIAPQSTNFLCNPEQLPALFESGEPVQAGGRGAARVTEFEGNRFLVRPYLRGGLPGRVVNRSFLYWGERNVRGVREFNLLLYLRELGLPVPKPILTTYARRGPVYRCKIMLEYIPAVRPLANIYTDLPEDKWYQLGVLIRRFHQANVCHVDLNAFNILIGSENIYLIDFDKCYILPELTHGSVSSWWLRRNLDRLYRSLLKLGFGNQLSSSRKWQALVKGYNDGESNSPVRMRNTDKEP